MKSRSTMKRIPIISLSSAQLKKDDYTFFVLRSNKSKLEFASKYEDIFCVVRDSYASLIYKEIENECNLNENGNTQKNKSISTLKQTELFFDTFKKTKDNDKLSDPKLSIRDVTTYNPSNDKNDKYENNYDSVFKVTFNFELFKIYLVRFFGINISKGISYFDNDDVLRLVKNETDFLELWQFAKFCSKRSKGVLLLVDFINNQDDDTNKNKYKVNAHSSDDNQKSSFANDSISSETFDAKKSMSEVKQENRKEHLNRIFDLTGENNNNTLNDKNGAVFMFPNLTTTYSKILTKSFDNMKLESTTPSNLTTQDSLNNAPPTWFVQYMEQLKKDIITEVSDQIMLNVMENLNKCSMRSPICTESKDTSRCENQSHRLRSKYNHQRNNLLTDQRRQYKRKKRDMLVDKIYSEHIDKPLVNIVKSRKKQVKKFEEKLEYSSEPNEDKEEENVQNESYNSSKLMSDINNAHKQNDISEKQIVNKRNSSSPNFLALESSKENLYNEPNIFNGTKENKFRMNCSITEHQMLDENYFKNTTCCCGSDIENISINSDLSNNIEVCDDHNEFELISVPMKHKTNTNCHMQRSLSKNQNMKNIAHKEDNDDEIVTDLSSFDLLPEVSGSSVICINENHFTDNLSNTLTPIIKKDLNNVSTHKSDEKENSNNEDNINKKIHDTHLSNTSKTYMYNNSADLTNNICSLFIKNTSKSIDENTNLLHAEPEHNNINAMKIDVNSSHTSYLTTEPINPIYPDLPIAQHSCQAPQTDLNDLTQSFHSHTTSITDNGVYGISETNTSNSHDYSNHSFSDSNTTIASKKNNIREQIKKDLNNKYLEKNPTIEENKNVGHIIEETTTDTMPGTAEPIHILPETLVIGAFHFASIAYGTAREAIVRIRSTSKDDRLSYMRKTPRH